MAEIKPCPFCGGEVRRYVGFNGLHFFKCEMCTAVVSFNNDYLNSSKKKAIEAFNRRDNK